MAQAQAPPDGNVQAQPTPAGDAQAQPPAAADAQAAPAPSERSDAVPPEPEPAPAPPPDVLAGERSDGRLDPMPRRRWRLLPQVLLFPFRALFWALEWPIGKALRYEDVHHPFKRVVDAFTWSGGGRGLRPAFYYSTIYVPEFGLKYFDHLSLGVDTRLDVTMTTFGPRYFYADLLVEPTRVSAPIGVIFDTSFDRRADLLYNGLGNHTYSDAPNSRYMMNALESHLQLRLRPIRGIAFYANFATGLKRFENGDRIHGESGIIYVYDTAMVPGFTHGTTYVRVGGGIDIDTRESPVRASSGIVLHAAFDYSNGIDGDESSYERLYGMVGVPINLWARTRVLWLSAATAATWQNGDVPVPFSELPTLGGPNDLRGFRFQDFRDYSAFYVTAEYRWPIWMWVDGALFFDYGGVFGQNYAGFGAKRMQPDVGVSLRLITSNLYMIRMNVGYGFGEGFNFSIAGSGP